MRVAAMEATLVDTAFLDLLCHDEELLRAEFDELISAGWPTPPPPPPPPAMPRPAERPPWWTGPTLLAQPGAAAGRPAGPADERHRQRSPPRRQPVALTVK
jgi:hypothetical protein